jgi:glycosyltransferase involved in cell wall biosynthesis
MSTVSVLLSTYASESDAHLRASLQSLFQQSVPPDQIVLVVDGPVPAAQEKVVTEASNNTRVRDFTVLRLHKNVGLAAAMNEGLPFCAGEWTMRMDSDDVCLPDRLCLQLAYALNHPDIDVVSSWSEEFYPDNTRLESKCRRSGTSILWRHCVGETYWSIRRSSFEHRRCGLSAATAPSLD